MTIILFLSQKHYPLRQTASQTTGGSRLPLSSQFFQIIAIGEDKYHTIDADQAFVGETMQSTAVQLAGRPNHFRHLIHGQARGLPCLFCIWNQTAVLWHMRAWRSVTSVR